MKFTKIVPFNMNAPFEDNGQYIQIVETDSETFLYITRHLNIFS